MEVFILPKKIEDNNTGFMRKKREIHLGRIKEYKKDKRSSRNSFTNNKRIKIL